MWPEEDKTQELLRRVSEGDDDAVNRLFTRHRDALCRMVGYHLDPALARRVDASDVVQEVFIEASRRLSDYVRDPVMPFHLWLRQLAKDHVIGAYRKHRLAKKRSVDRERRIDVPAFSDRSSVQLAAQLVAGGTTPAAEAIRKELQQRFVDCIEQLPSADREIIIMRHFEQLSNQDAARVLQISEPAAGMRYLRALRRLRGLLGDEQVD